MRKTKLTRHTLAGDNGSEQISFLPEPDYNPKLPPKNTLAYRALILMLQGKSISHPDFEDKTDSWRLAAHIHILNKLGWRVKTVQATHNARKKSVTRHICRYFLSPMFIQKINDAGVFYD